MEQSPFSDVWRSIRQSVGDIPSDISLSRTTVEGKQRRDKDESIRKEFRLTINATRIFAVPIQSIELKSWCCSSTRGSKWKKKSSFPSNSIGEERFDPLGIQVNTDEKQTNRLEKNSPRERTLSCPCSTLRGDNRWCRGKSEDRWQRKKLFSSVVDVGRSNSILLFRKIITKIVLHWPARLCVLSVVESVKEREIALIRYFVTSRRCICTSHDTPSPDPTIRLFHWSTMNSKKCRSDRRDCLRCRDQQGSAHYLWRTDSRGIWD